MGNAKVLEMGGDGVRLGQMLLNVIVQRPPCLSMPQAATLEDTAMLGTKAWDGGKAVVENNDHIALRGAARGAQEGRKKVRE